MKSLILAAILGIVPELKPWPSETLEGVVRVEREELILFGEGQKELVIELNDHDVALCFARDADYREAERLSGSLVRIEGCKVRRGNQSWFAVTGLRERR